ncbi:RcnB family protein [Tsuneonella flava]|uniref:RcnB family protein n=1 Tax=Tsuneonella flava TaxID=2055955 RepID=A0ABX7K8U7_9SPHN|nr:RcnB family protein [Tsuneonella flava]QSB44690.1 RcnB family protein [Tsuneonella flava]
MTLKALLHTGAAAAIAAAMAFAALPTAANAAERGPRWGREDAPRMERQSRQERPQRTVRAPVQTQTAPPQRRAEQRAPVVQQRSGGNWNRNDRGTRTWNRSDSRPANTRTDAQRAGVPAWDRSGRNRSYTDNNRNRSYSGRDGDRRNNWRDNRRTDNRSRGTYNRDNRHWNGNRQTWNRDRNGWDHRRDNRRWSRNWRSNSHYDWHRYRSHNRSVFRIGRYYAPYNGYRYSRVGIGFYLNNLFFSSRYWINDPGYYRLPPAYGPYRWVRYYDDVLLVDIYSGEVVDVIHNFFW